MTSNKRSVEFITGKVTKVGNSGHIVLPKDWIGQEVYVTSLSRVRALGVEKALKNVHVRNIR